MNKPQIVCIHGFGKRNIREYDFFVEWFKDRFDITIPLLFDLNDETDTD